MNATKILWGQVLLVSTTVLAFVWAATQWTAWQLGFQPGLGQPTITIRPGFPIRVLVTQDLVLEPYGG